MAFDRLIVDTLLPAWPVVDETARQHAGAHTLQAVARAIARAPFHVRLGVGVLSAGIGALLWLKLIGAGSRESRVERAEQLYAFLQRLPGPAGSVIRLYRSATLLAYYEYPVIAPLMKDGGRIEGGPA